MAKKPSAHEVFLHGSAEEIRALLATSPGKSREAFPLVLSRRDVESLRAVLAVAPLPGLVAEELKTAIETKKTATLRLLLEAGASPAPYKTLFPLHEAARAKFAAGVELLLEKGADPNLLQPPLFDAPHFFAQSPLCCAIEADSLASVRALLAAGANPNEETAEGFFLLEVAEMSGVPSIIAALRKAGARAPSAEELTLAKLAQRGDLARFLAACPSASAAELRAAFEVAVRWNRVEEVEACLVHPLFPPGAPWAAMFRACVERQGGLLRALVTARPVDWSSPPPPSRSPLWRAAHDAWAEGLAILLESGADPRSKGAGNETLLRYVQKEKHPDCLDVIRLYGAEAKGAKPTPSLRQQIPGQRRTTWEAWFRDASASPGGSRFGGCPLLNPGETWPKNPGGKPLLFLAQLELSSLPAPHKGEGLFQFFIDESLPNGHKPGLSWLRVFLPQAKATVAAPPLGARVLQERAVKRWKREDDYPSLRSYAKLFSGAKTSNLSALEAAAKGFSCRPGDKLGGWPRWLQNDQSRTDWIFFLQLDSENVTDFSWGDAGTAFVFQLPDGSFDFLWECL